MVSLERRLTASVLKSREAASNILKHVDKDTLTSYSLTLFNIAEEFYERDRDKKDVDFEHIADAITLKIDNVSKRELYVQYARECLAVDISPINVAELLLETKRKETASELAQALVNSTGADATLVKQIDEYKELLTASVQREDRHDSEILHCVSVEQVNEEVLNTEGLIQLVSKQFTGQIGGGVMRGHNILIFARPETGKSALALTMASSLVLQNLKGIYFENEEPIKQTVERFQGCLSKIARLDRLRDPKAANSVLMRRGYENIKFVSLAPGSVDEIDEWCEKENPDWIIVNQLRNLKCRAENRTNQLEIIVTDLRSLAKRRNLVSVSVTQAGDSANKKLVLEMGDIDSSNTGIPAAMDLMIGLGLNEEFYSAGEVMISLPKNKINGNHAHWKAKLNKDLSRIEDLL